MNYRAPRRDLPPDAERWGRHVDETLQDLVQARERSDQSIANSFSQINGTMAALSQQITTLTEVVTTLSSLGTVGASSVLPVNWSVPIGGSTAWLDNSPSAQVKTVSGRLTLLGNTISEWNGYKSAVHLGYRVVRTETNELVYNYGDRNVSRLTNPSDTDVTQNVVLSDTLVLDPGTYTVTLAYRAFAGASVSAFGSFYQKSLIVWAY